MPASLGPRAVGFFLGASADNARSCRVLHSQTSSGSTFRAHDIRCPFMSAGALLQIFAMPARVEAMAELEVMSARVAELEVMSARVAELEALVAAKGAADAPKPAVNASDGSMVPVRASARRQLQGSAECSCYNRLYIVYTFSPPDGGGAELCAYDSGGDSGYRIAMPLCSLGAATYVL